MKIFLMTLACIAFFSVGAIDGDSTHAQSQAGGINMPTTEYKTATSSNGEKYHFRAPTAHGGSYAGASHVFFYLPGEDQLTIAESDSITVVRCVDCCFFLGSSGNMLGSVNMSSGQGSLSFDVPNGFGNTIQIDIDFSDIDDDWV